MKKLTFSSMAAARLRANKRQYMSLVVGIFLSVFLVSTLVLSVFGIYQRFLQKRYDKVGDLDLVFLDNTAMTEEKMLGLADIESLGYAYISGEVTDGNLYLGYYDKVGMELMNLTPIEGRLPETSGEIALEASALDVLEVQWKVGDTVDISITPIDGVKETRQFTIVGILPERSVYLERTDSNNIGKFPAILTFPEEAPFSTGRIANHALLKLKRDVQLSYAIHNIFEYQATSEVLTSFYGLSITGEQVTYYSPTDLFYVEEEMFSLIYMALGLAAALILSCAVGISGAMEGVLSKRREEIGVLRALGATRRQIRKMFGQENLIIAVIMSPLSITVSCLAVWGLSILLPETLKFSFSIWLLLPIALFSVIVILLSGYLPLVRSSKLMPMSVIRDTAMLRRSKGVKSKKVFSPTKLMSTRQVRFNPTRQFGAALLVALMLACSGLLGSLLVNARLYLDVRNIGFMVRTDHSYSSQYVQTYDYASMDKRGLNQIKGLNHVESLELERELPVHLLLENSPMYAMTSIGAFDNYGMLSDEDFARTKELNVDTWAEEHRDEVRNEYLEFCETYGFEQNVFSTLIITLDMTDKNVALLKDDLETGKIDVEAINAGQQVLVYAPKIWTKDFDTGGYTAYSGESEAERAEAEGAKLAVWNDTFTAGMMLPITQLFCTEQDGEVFRKDATVQVCGVLNDMDESFKNPFGVCLITTEQGLENMGLQPEGLYAVQVNLDGEVSLEEEELLERQLSAIARRYSGYTIYNQMENYRERQQAHQQTILLVIAVVTVFFAVSVSMIVSSVTRQLNSEGRTIGMLRAVGADEKAILGCYSGSLNAAVFGGLIICLGLFILFLVFLIIDAMPHGYNPFDGQMTIILAFLVTALAMAAACWLLARQILRLRIREIVNKSIIDNIREL